MVDDCCLETEIRQSSLRLPIGNTLPFWRKVFENFKGESVAKLVDQDFSLLEFVILLCPIWIICFQLFEWMDYL